MCMRNKDMINFAHLRHNQTTHCRSRINQNIIVQQHGCCLRTASYPAAASQDPELQWNASEIDYLTSKTGILDNCITLLVTDPNNKPCMPPFPRGPMTIRSYRFSVAKRTIISAGSPTVI